MTATEFLQRLTDIEKKYKTLYVQGCFGDLLTVYNMNYFIYHTTFNQQSERQLLIKQAAEKGDIFGFDCVNLIKGVLWGWTGDKNAEHGGAIYCSNNLLDIGADQMMDQCDDISYDFSDLDKILPGEALGCSGHIGVYIGKGLAIECTPRWKDCVQITSCNCDIPGYNRRDWTRHGKLPYIDYDTTEIFSFEDITNTSEILPINNINLNFLQEENLIDYFGFQFRENMLMTKIYKTNVTSKAPDVYSTTSEFQNYRNSRLMWCLLMTMHRTTTYQDWSFSAETAAGLLGYCHGESGMDPRNMEGGFSEDAFPLDSNTINWDAAYTKIDNVFAYYSTHNIGYDPSGYEVYMAGEPTMHYVSGVGIAGFTGGTINYDNLLASEGSLGHLFSLAEWCKKNGYSRAAHWTTITCQLATMFSHHYNIDNYYTLVARNLQLYESESNSENSVVKAYPESKNLKDYKAYDEKGENKGKFQIVSRTATGTYGMPGWQFDARTDDYPESKAKHAEEAYLLFKHITSTNAEEIIQTPDEAHGISEADAKEDYECLKEIWAIIDANPLNLQWKGLPISEDTTQNIPTEPEHYLISLIKKYNLDMDLTPLIDPYLVHSITIDGEKINIENDQIILIDSITRYIEKKLFEYKKTKYLQINNHIYPLISNNVLSELDLTNDIINIFEEQTEDKKNEDGS